MRRQIGLLAVLFLAAHVVSLPPTLEDIDSINFALGVRDFNVAQHQPHPPGYPVFIALGKAATGALRAIEVPAAPVRALSLLSVVAGAALVVLLIALFRALASDRTIAWWAMAIAVCSPLFWFTALRPLSDMAGLAVAVAAQVLLLRAMGPADGEPDDLPAARRVLLYGGAALAGLGAGVRIQAAVLTVPLLVAALLWPRTGFSIRGRLVAIGAAAAGVLVWLVPMIADSGGIGGYLEALTFQAGEDFADVVMLWTTPTPRVALNAALSSFAWPWGSIPMGLVVMALAAAGLVRALYGAPRLVWRLAIAFGPYAVFHLLFQDTPMVRYALPLVVPVGLLAIYAAAPLGRAGLAVTALTIVASSLLLALPAARAYGRDESPAFKIFAALPKPAGQGSGADGRETLAMHAVMRRVEEWERGNHAARVIPPRHGREWLALVEHWRRNPDSSVRFVADRRRTDLVLFDPHARSLELRTSWALPEMPFLAGTRPGPADLYMMRPPGWMLERGWALTAEVGGVTARMGLGPHIEPAVAWVRARREPAALILGGRNLENPGEPAARLTLSGDAGPIGTWEARSGFFLWQVQLPSGSLAGSGYIPLRVAASAADQSGRRVRVALEQFDLQSEGVVMFGFGDGWYEPEYSPATGRAWRWISERGRLWIRPVDRDVTVTISGESPLRYFDRPPVVRVLAAGSELARFAPSADFDQTITVPAAALRQAGGLITVESDLWFTPAERGESADPRRLAMRIYSVAVR